jgi:hypothetical protein
VIQNTDDKTKGILVIKDTFYSVLVSGEISK